MMNKYEKAFNHLREHVSFDTVDEMIDIKELVERATPKKIEYVVGLYGKEKHCPNCDTEVLNFANYCHLCGQALGWRVEDDE